MILLDDDPQKGERLRNEAIAQRAVGVKCIFANLPCDVAFYGMGEGRELIGIGIEIKKPDDMADSVVRSGRLVNQFRRAKEYGLSVLYLIHEGIVRPSRGDGLLEKWGYDPNTRQQGWVVTNPMVEYRRWDNFMTTCMSRGIMVKRTSDHFETAFSVVDLYWWWQTPPEEHQSLDRFYTPVVLNKHVPLFRKVIKEFDGIGWDRSIDFYNEFVDKGISLLDVLNGYDRHVEGKKEEETRLWRRVRGVGKGIADSMWDALNRPIGNNGT